jgi:hypothetical protein
MDNEKFTWMLACTLSAFLLCAIGFPEMGIVLMLAQLCVIVEARR